MAALDTSASSSSGVSARKRVRFLGSHYIEYDAEQAPVVRLGGAARCIQSVATATSCDDLPAVDSELLTELQRECAARRLDVANSGDAIALQRALSREYANELRCALQARGFDAPSVVADASTSDDINSSNSSNSDADVATLQRQFEIAEFLHAQVALQVGAQCDASASVDDDTASLSVDDDTASLSVDDDTASLLALPELPTALLRLQLAKKELAGHVDDGYVFGRRFCSVATFINTLEFDALVALAQTRALAVPDLSDAEKKAIVVVERELCARHTTTGRGKPLKQLTLRELTAEAYARELIVVHARDRDGKRSKKGLIDKLRPVMRQEVRDEKILDKRDDLLRALLLDVLEKEAAQHQTRALVQLIEQHLARLGPQPTAAADGTAEMDIDESSSSSSSSTDDADAVHTQLQRSYCLLFRRLGLQAPR